MKTIKGIDVSEHQGMITWSLVKNNIDFAILRCGYGKGHLDKQFNRNANECEKYGIPYGVYWFSYALSVEDAINEADNCCRYISNRKIDLPVAFDWEYDSDNHAAKYGVVITDSIRQSFAKKFLDTVRVNGYTPMLYTNEDYLNKGFKVFMDGGVDIWLAQWSGSVKYKCKYWQYSSTGKINGIIGNVDMNVGYIDESSGNTTSQYGWLTDTACYTRLCDYDVAAEKVIAGKYSTGTSRVSLLKSDGYDYKLVQAIVNFKMKNR